MTAEEREPEDWANLGRAIQDFVEDLEIQGWHVMVRWERGAGHVMIRVSDGHNAMEES